MALYLGSEKRKLVLNNIAYDLNLFIKTIVTDGTLLLSSDDYILVDSDGLYLATEESE